MKSMKAKTKAKKPNGKFGKVKFPSVEAVPDLSQLRPPIDTSISTLYRVTKLLENGSDEVKAILSYECDLMYECRICRSIFRSLINLISHKRVYCKEKFDITRYKHYDTTFVNKLDAHGTEKVFEEPSGNDRILRSQTNKPKEKKDLTAIVNMLQIKRLEKLESNNEQSSVDSANSDPPINDSTQSTNLVQQTATSAKVKGSMQEIIELSSEIVQCNHQLNNNNVTELNSIGSRDKTDVATENEHICPICYEKFSTKKTLSVHTRTVHTSHRLCYPCPCCPVVFANTWSAYRHLYKVHKKTNDQVRKLRSQIQQSAFIKGTAPVPSASKEIVSKTATSSVNDRINETQEWMDHLESDTELQRCGGCGKRFDRRVALLSHLQHCQMRIVAFEGSIKGKKISKSSSDSVQNGNTATNNGNVSTWEVENNVDARSSPDSNGDGMPFRVGTVASLSKDEWERLNNEDEIAASKRNDVPSNLTNGAQERNVENLVLPINDNPNSVEIVYININKRKNNVGSKKRKNKHSARKVVDDTYKANETNVNDEQNVRTGQLDYSQTMEKKLLSIVNFEKLQCLPCKQKFSSVNSLRKHAANHIGWNRFACKLCDYKCFVKSDCAAHCNKVHNAQNNRIVIEEMITWITDDQFMPASDQNVSGTNSDEEEEVEDVDMPEVVEVSIVPDHMESVVQIREDSSEPESTSTKSCPEGSVHANDENSEENSDNGMKMGLDPEVKKMVLEVIFGPSEVDSMEQAEARKVQQNKEDDAQAKEKNSRENDSVQDNTKPQRPIRKKMKPLNKDFIYDLKDLTIRKFPVILKPLNKSLSKKYALQEEESAEKELEQPAKRFKPGHNGELATVYENDVSERAAKQEDDLKDKLTFTQCHS